MSNTGAAGTGNVVVSSAVSVGQRFTTGSRAGGYPLDSIGVNSRNALSSTTGLTAKIYTVGTDGLPDAVVHTLVVPDSIPSGEALYTAPAGATLSADTDYIVTLEGTGSFSGQPAQSATGGSETGEAGWSILDNRHQRVGTGAWEVKAENSPLVISVYGPVPVLVSNLGRTPSTTTGSVSSQPFTTGSNAAGYAVTGVTIGLGGVLNSPRVHIVPQTTGGEPDLSDADDLIALAAPSPVTADALNTFTAPADTTLAADTTYQVLVTGPTFTVGPGAVERTGSTAEDAGGAAGWTIGNTRYWRNTGVTAWSQSTSDLLRMEILGSAIVSTDDATLSGLAVNDGTGDVTLAPAFDAATTEYRASVGAALEQATVRATTNNPNATVAWLDGDEEPLDDADGGAAGFQVELAEGGNTFKIQVTAEDTAAMETYTVVVYRNPGCAAESVWCTTLTVGAPAGGSGLGYCSGAGNTHCGYGALDDADFVLDGTTYSVRSVRWGNFPSVVHLTLDADVPAATQQQALLLRILTDDFGFPDATRGNDDGDGSGGDGIPHNYRWYSSVAYRQRTEGLTFTVQLLDLRQVPAGWSLAPDAVTAGGTFRLLFASSTTRTAQTSAISDYDNHVRDAAAAGHADIRDYSSIFAAIASSASDGNARDNTRTRATDPDAPIYWVSETATRSAVATGYADFYDGTWGDTESRDESGALRATNTTSTALFTGTDTDGTTSTLPLGNSGNVRQWITTATGVTNGATSAQNRRPLLALSPILTVAAPPAVVLVSNLGKANNGGIFGVGGTSGRVYAQKFTTGPSDGGYGLAAADVRFQTFDAADDEARVSIYSEDADGDPDASLVVLVNPDSIESNGANAFAAPAGTTLAAETSYFVVVEATTGSYSLHPTNSDDEDAGAADGWSIHDGVHRKTSGDWSGSSGAAMKVAIRGYAVAGATTTNTAPAFDEGASTARFVDENTAAGEDIEDPVSATDLDAGDTLTYSLEGTNASSFEIDSTNGQLKTKANVDYDHETMPTYGVTVKVVDLAGASDTIVVTINVADVPEKTATPAAPDVEPVAGTTDSLAVTWAAPGLNGGPDIVRYKLQIKRTDEGPSSWRPFNTTLNRAHTYTGLSADTEYEVQVAAWNDELYSDWSPSGTERTHAATAETTEVRFGASTYTAVEGGAAARVTVRLSRAHGAAVTIPLTTTNEGGASAGDYSGIPASVAFGASQTSASFDVLALSDDIDESGERVRIGFGTLPGDIDAGSPATATVELRDDNAAADARVTFLGDGALAATEGASVARVQLSLTDDGLYRDLPGGLDRDVTVPLTVAYLGGATAADLESVQTSVTFAAGQSEAEVLVRPADDAADDDCEAVVLGLGTLPAGLSPGLHTTKRVDLRDNDGTDTWYVSFEAAAYTAPEGGAASVAVVLGEPWKPRQPPCSGGVAALEIPLEVSAHGGGATAADYDVPASVTIPAGATRATFALRALDDADDDDGESVTLGMNWQRFPDGLRTGRGPTETVVSLADDDGATAVEVSFGAASYTVREGSGTVIIEVRLDRAPGREVEVPLTILRGDPGDLAGVPASVSFPPSGTHDTFHVAALDDNENDDGESVDIGFGVLPQAVTAGSPSVATVLIEDDDGDTPKHKVRLDTDNTNVRPLREGGCFRVHATLDPAADPELALPLVATPLRGATAADYSDLPAHLVFAAGETRSSYRVCGVDDTVEDPGEGLKVEFGPLPAGVSAQAGRDVATFDIVDNDGPPSVSIGDASARERPGRSPYARLIFQLDLDRRADAEVSVDWRTEDGTATAGEDYEAASGTATFRRGEDWVQIAVWTIHDEVAEGNETMTVVLSGPEGLRIADGTGTGTILDARGTSGVADAFVSGALLTLRYAHPLDTGSTPDPKDWVVRAAGGLGARTMPVMAVAVRDEEVVLTLSRPAAPADTVTVSYLPWAMHPLRASPDGPDAAPLTVLPVRNETGFAPGGPNRDAATLPPAYPGEASAPSEPRLTSLPAESPASAPTRLDLPDRGLTEVSALAGLTELDALDLSGNALTDTWPLATLSNLSRLDLSGNRIGDIAPLTALVGLEVLDLSGNGVSDVSALAALTNLRRLDLSSNRIVDIVPLAALTGLEALDLSGNGVSDISALAALSNLRRLDLSGNAVSDAGALVALSGLEVLILDGNAVADPGPVAHLPRLARLDLSGNRVADVALMTGLASLERLDLSGNRIAHPAALRELSGLMWLDLRANPVSDVSALGQLAQLRWLWLDPRAPGLGALTPMTVRPAPLRVDSVPPAPTDVAH